MIQNVDLNVLHQTMEDTKKIIFVSTNIIGNNELSLLFIYKIVYFCKCVYIYIHTSYYSKWFI